ncbi:hypothetical protein V2J09_015713 [Rumex salicifolius]
MGRSPSSDENGLKKGPWTSEEDKKLVDHIERHGHGSWRALPKLAGLNRCGKSCRLRWTNYLRPDIKRGKFSQDEEQTIINLHSVLGNKWSAIASHLAGRTDNEIKNYWNTHLKKKLLQMGIDPVTHKPRTDLSLLANLPQLLAASGLTTMVNTNTPLENATQLAKLQLLQNILQVLSTNPNPNHVGDLSTFLGSPISSSTQNSHLLDGLVGDSTHQAPYNCFESTPQVNNSSHYDINVTNMSTLIGLNGDMMPTLVHADDSLVGETSNANQIEKGMLNDAKTINKDVSKPSSTMTTNTTSINAWNEIMDDEASNSYWRDLIK